ncbi:hypothetical protein HPP92_008122 [Vanilla planifolia]|uniref:Uncharacterized protein n=1 Tax=Vanilla planifolia TaxID=51239 RepID=A0A835VAP8_VANPL|nr:hypothetical protein HPP92_008122 [Vanilla planifolia]
MDGANSDNESRSTSSFPHDPPLLEVLSRKKRKKKRWEFNPGVPLPGTRSSSSAVPPHPPPPPNDQFADVECPRVANNATIGRLKLVSSFSIDVLILLEPFISGDQIPPICCKLGLMDGICSSNGKIWILWSNRLSGSTHRVPCPSDPLPSLRGGMPPSFFFGFAYGQHSGPLRDLSGRTSWLTLLFVLPALGGSVVTSRHLALRDVCMLVAVLDLLGRRLSAIIFAGLLIPCDLGQLNFTWQAFDYFLRSKLGFGPPAGAGLSRHPPPGNDLGPLPDYVGACGVARSV